MDGFEMEQIGMERILVELGHWSLGFRGVEPRRIWSATGRPSDRAGVSLPCCSYGDHRDRYQHGDLALLEAFDELEFDEDGIVNGRALHA